ncbi:MAG TPA: translocation/assembly module TamB domain-containing protein [Cyclobacteriaceae bacterium]|nr:translocation/assembly module TamB domain-containing protein [Cyclobacteriaceae bacterium]
MNINIFIKNINHKLSSGSGGKSSAKLNISEIALNNSKFNYDDNENDSIKNGFDYYHFNLDVDDGEINSFQVIGDTIQFDVKSLDVLDHQTKMKISDLSTYFRISQASMEFLNLDLKAGKSIVSDTIIFTYRSQDDLSDDFNRLVNIRAKLKNTILDPHDLALFTYGLPPLPHPVKLNGVFNGKVSRFTFSKMSVAWGNSRIEGRLSMDGMPNINETFTDLKIKEGVIDQNDIQFVLAQNTAKALHPLGKIHVRGEYTGFPNDFVARGNLLTQLGKINSDVNLKINEADVSQSTFSGHMNLDDFKLGSYLNDTINYQRVTLDGKVKGRGLTRENTDFILTGTVRSFGFRHYNYSNINTNARFARQLFNGDLSINDPNLIFNAKAFIDFRRGKELIQVKANLDTAFFDKLGFTKRPLFVRSYFDVNTSGLKLDSLFGSIVLRNSVVNFNNETLALDSVHLISTKEGTDRQLQLRSSIADFVMKGDYRYSTLFNDAQKFGRELYLKINNNREALDEHYQKKKTNTQSYQVSFDLKIRDMRPLAGLGKVDLYASSGSSLKGNFLHSEVSSLHFNSKMDTVIFKGKSFLNNEVEFRGTKSQDSLELNASLMVRSANQYFSNSFKTKNVLAQAQWEKDHVRFDIDADQEGNTNIIRLKSELDFLRDSIRVKILPTQLRIFDEDWSFSQENYAIVKGLEWNIHRLQVNKGAESAMIDGFISENPNRSLILSIDSLNLDILNSLLQEKISGEVNGTVEAKDLYHNPFVQNKLNIHNLTVDEFLVGNVSGLNLWNREKKRFDLNFSLERNGKKTVEMEGFYDPAQASPLNVNAKLENTNIKIIEPFMRGIFSNMDGALTGDYTITGTFLEPIIRGDGKIQSAQLMIDYLKTTYYITGSLGFSPTQITFKDFSLTDGLKNQAMLDGFLAHRNYREFRINLDAYFRNFQLLNTNPKDNSLFYGQAFGTGNLNILGPISNLKISATARTEKGTRIFIPLNGSMDNTTKKDFITFVNFADTLKLKTEEKKKAKNKEEPTGISMDMNLDITPDAYAEMIFDIKSGDIIRGYGKGDLKLQIDTKGDFTMFGAYEFERGNYNFTLYDIINKEFTINKGSSITWFGDPYEATLAINASYKQLVSFAPTISSTDPGVLNSPQMRRKYPAEVLLKLDGAMMSPQINFDIIAKDLPNNVPIENKSTSVALNQEFKQFRAKLDEQELKRQVFSLIMLRRFSSPDAFATGGGSTLYSSVSELLSNQLSYWLTQVDQNLEVNFDLGNFDQEAFNTFQLRLSYSFLNGRLRVTRDGVFNNQTNKSEMANMLGDWTVDYLLTPDGKFKVKMYNRTNINQLSQLTQQTAITTGVSLMNTQSFNSWKELLTAARNRRKKELEQKPKVAEDGTP